MTKEELYKDIENFNEELFQFLKKNMDKLELSEALQLYDKSVSLQRKVLLSKIED